MTSQNENERLDMVEVTEEAAADEAASTEGASETATLATSGEVEEPVAADEEADSFYQYLTSEYRRFRLLTWVLGGCGFALILVSVGLNQTGVVSLGIYNIMMSVAYLFIVLMAVTIFTRTRPFKRRMKEFKGEPISRIRDDDAPDGVLIEDGKFRDMDDVYKILERDVRTEVIPDLPEYRKLRRTWLSVYAAAAVLAVASLLLYYLQPNLGVIATLMLLGAFALVVVAFYLDRTRMKPLRNEWARRYGMTEMQMRDNLRAIR